MRLCALARTRGGCWRHAVHNSWFVTWLTCVVLACCICIRSHFARGTMCFESTLRTHQWHDVLQPLKPRSAATMARCAEHENNHGATIGSMSWRPHGLLADRQRPLPSSTCASTASPTRAMPTLTVLSGLMCGSCPMGRESRERWGNALARLQSCRVGCIVVVRRVFLAAAWNHCSCS